MDGVDLSVLPFEDLIEREWLVVNGIGGYASSTLPSLNSRKYHGLLVAAMSAPVKPMVLLSRVEETVTWDGKAYALACNEYPGAIHPRGHQMLGQFSQNPLPCWTYRRPLWTLKKTLQMLEGQNTVCLSYTLADSDEPVDLEIRPLFALRGIHELMSQFDGRLMVETQQQGHHRLAPTSRTPECFFAHDGDYHPQACWNERTVYRREHERGYESHEDLWSPGVVRWRLRPGQTVWLICSTDPIDLEYAIMECRRQAMNKFIPVVDGQTPDPLLDPLVRAASQFVVSGREGTARIMGGYPWAALAGRDAMISLPGLLLVTGRLDRAKSLLLCYANHLDHGLAPNEWPLDDGGPKYTSADASLWFVNAVYQYLRYGGEAGPVGRTLYEAIEQILMYYHHGTALGIRTTPDGLIASRQPSVPTSWMDAKIDDWVVTPRAGCTVELNALWHNALRIGAQLAREYAQPGRAEEYLSLAQSVRVAFNERFWNDSSHCCYDVVNEDGVDASIRPNQILAMSLPFAVLDIERHADVLKKVRDELLTPMGVRTLASFDPAYRGRYGGCAADRDRAYHQGSAFPWLLGPLVTAWVRVHGRGKVVRNEAACLLEPCLQYMRGRGMGQLCELFDGDLPQQRPGGLIASARSVAEILRCYVEDILDLPPAGAATVGRTAAEGALRITPLRSTHVEW